MQKPRAGFTIVELLIVIVVIAILAAISIVAYNSIQSRARLSAQQAAASQTERAIMTYALQTNSESISLGGTLVGYKEGTGDISLLRPLVGTPDITMYAVYEVISTSGSYSKFAQLSPTMTGNYFMLQTDNVGGNGMNYRIDTSAEGSRSHQTTGLRIPGNTLIGWLQVSNNGLTRSYGYNQAASLNTAGLSPHSGWNFTGLSVPVFSDGTVRVALVFNAAHDQTTRAQVVGWLAQKYGVSL